MAKGAENRLKVMGIGGGGTNAIAFLEECPISGVELWALNTDKEALERLRSAHLVQLGKKETRGRGTGGDQEKGRMAAEESREEIREALKGCEVAVLSTALGGGTGSGATPIVADLTKEMGILTIVIATRPFRWEGPHRLRVAEEVLAILRKTADGVVSISNDRLLQLPEAEHLPASHLLQLSHITLRNAVATLSYLLNTHGLVNRDLSDIETFLKKSGSLYFGWGEGRGKRGMEEATLHALHSPILEISPGSAHALLLNILAGKDLTLSSLERGMEVVRKEAKGEDGYTPEICWGLVTAPEEEEEVKVGLLAVSLFSPPKEREKPIRMEQQTFPWEKGGIDLPPFRLDRAT